MLLGRSWSTAPSLAGGVKSSANIVRGISRGTPHSCHRFLSAGTEAGGQKGGGAGSSSTVEPKQRSQRRGNSRDGVRGKSVPQGRGRGSSSAFRAYQHAKLGQRQPSGGPSSSRFTAEGKGGSKSKGEGGSKGRGKGGKGAGRNLPQAPRVSATAFGKSAAPPTFVPGQFDDVDVPPGVMIEQSISTLIDATSRAPNGVLVFDYEPTEKEKKATIAQLPGNISDRSIEELLSYRKLDAALGTDRAAEAADFAHDAWEVSSSNPLITHKQRVEVAEHIDNYMKEIESSGDELLDFVLTPPAE